PAETTPLAAGRQSQPIFYSRTLPYSQPGQPRPEVEPAAAQCRLGADLWSCRFNRGDLCGSRTFPRHHLQGQRLGLARPNPRLSTVAPGFLPSPPQTKTTVGARTDPGSAHHPARPKFAGSLSGLRTGPPARLSAI